MANAYRLRIKKAPKLIKLGGPDFVWETAVGYGSMGDAVVDYETENPGDEVLKCEKLEGKVRRKGNGHG